MAWLPAALLVIFFLTGVVPGTRNPFRAPNGGQRTVTISNVEPRRDTAGDILEAGDGMVAYFGGRYYLYGVRYQPCKEPDATCYVTGGNLGPPEYPAGPLDCSDSGPRPGGLCCGWRGMTFAVYSSPDLLDWVLESTDALPAMSDPASPHSSSLSMMNSPFVLRSPATGLYVMWFQHVLRTSNSTAGIATGAKAVATSAHPAGPFTVHRWSTSPASAGFLSSTGHSLWMSRDGSAYMAHNGASALN
eukprot:gene4528-4756_t